MLMLSVCLNIDESWLEVEASSLFSLLSLHPHRRLCLLYYNIVTRLSAVDIASTITSSRVLLSACST